MPILQRLRDVLTRSRVPWVDLSATLARVWLWWCGAQHRLAGVSLVEQRRRLARHIDDYRAALGLIDQAVFRVRSLDEARALAGALASVCADPHAAGFGLLELLANAVEHGNLGIGFEDKAALLAAGRWEEEVTARLAAPENAGKFVEVRCTRERARLSVSIRDQGKGFDWRAFLAMDPARTSCPNGRGIALAREVAFDSIQYAAQGSRVEVTLRALEVARPGAHLGREPVASD